MAKKLKAFVRYDGSGRIIPGSLILQRFKPRVGNWKETPAYECCNYTPTNTFNFDVTADWSLTTPNVVDEASFKTFLESGEDGDGNTNNLTDVVITDFLLEGNRLRCNLSANGNGLYLGYVGVSDADSIGSIVGLENLTLQGNEITNFDPSTALPSSLLTLRLGDNQIVTFNPSIALPIGLLELNLGDNQIIDFDPTIGLPNTLTYLDLEENQIITFNPSIALPNSLEQLILGNNQIVTFNPSIDLPTGLIYLYLSGNQIVNFTPSNSLGSGLQLLFLQNNLIVNFDPGVALSNSLGNLFLNNNQIVTFNPTLPLPDSLNNFDLSNNQMTTAGYTASEPWASAMSVIPARGNIGFTGNINSASGTNLETILTAKGWTVYP
jgi:Leucine-rich repeat (LRR) protein